MQSSLYRAITAEMQLSTPINISKVSENSRGITTSPFYEQAESLELEFNGKSLASSQLSVHYNRHFEGYQLEFWSSNERGLED